MTETSDEIRRRIVDYRAEPDGLLKFGPQCLKIRTKAGQFPHLVLNRAQLYVHRLLEKQRAEKGYVRALILKGRQQGISTYIAARYYRKTALNKGVNTYILTHEQPASDTLFGMVDRFQKSNPLAPHVGTSNAKELEFDKLDSSYAVATAGTKAGGRSKSISLFHGSEVAFWPNAAEHFASSVQGVPLEAGTEVILESTSAGATGEFYERCQDASAGKGEYQLIFLPWWFSAEYTMPVPDDFELSQEKEPGQISEAEYQEMNHLSLGQMVWRRSKIHELRDPLLFRREYPADVEDAWTAPPGHEPYIDAAQVLRARKRIERIEGVGPLVIGIDPASGGGDRFSATGRRGLVVEFVIYRNKLNHEEAVAWIKALIREYQPARVNIDSGNIGANIVTSLKNIDDYHSNIVRGVNFGGTSEWRMARPKTPGPYNRRAEMWQRMRDWLDLPERPQLPDDAALQSDLTAPKEVPRLDNFFQLESKQSMKARGVRSPDLADSLALTFAFREYLHNYHQPVTLPGYGNVDAKAVREAESSPVVQQAQGPQSWMG